MQPNNLTALDFEDIKASIKAYLRTRTEFTDYDFDGSTLSYLIDLLSFNTYYTSFNANMALNEVFLNSSTVRDNVVGIAKLLNYIPTSIATSRACVKIEVQTTAVNGIYPSTVTLRKGSVATGGNYIWNILNNVTTTVDSITGKATFDKLIMREGNIIEYSYIVNTFANQNYIIPAQNVDTTTLTVRVRANESSTSSDLYNRVDNITALDATTRVYFLFETEDMRYQLRFGDGVVGRSLNDGEVIDLEYMVTNGPVANEVKTFSFIGRLVDNNGQSYSPATVKIQVLEQSQQGKGAESIESIKYSAPRFFAAQNRAVTAQDYAILTKKLYDNASSVVAYGGDSLNPPVYGKVYVAIKTKTGTNLNVATKREVSGLLRKYAMASIDPVVVDPDDMFIYNKIFAQYDTGCGSNSSSIKTDIQNSIQDWAIQTEINNFNSTFRANAFQKAISLSNKCISDVSLQTTLLKYITPATNQTNTYCVSIGSGLYNSSPSSDGDGSDGDGSGSGGGDGSGGNNTTKCYKEPVILSGTFRTYDRPGVDQQFEDDGYGLLRTFYNTGNKKVYTNNAAGTVNYDTGQVCFGPVNIIGAGSNIPDNTNLQITDTITGIGTIIDEGLGTGLPIDLRIPVNFIPSNNATIPATTPGTIINIVTPEITVAPIGTTPPPTIPLNSLTPGEFDQPPTTITIPPIDNSGNLTNSCF